MSVYSAQETKRWSISGPFLVAGGIDTKHKTSPKCLTKFDQVSQHQECAAVRAKKPAFYMALSQDATKAVRHLRHKYIENKNKKHTNNKTYQSSRANEWKRRCIRACLIHLKDTR